MAVEVELKLQIDAEGRRRLARSPLLPREAAQGGARKLHNIYFDTPELALHRRGVALRLRRQGRRWLQTVKCAGEMSGGLSSRPEWEQPYNGTRLDFGGIDDEKLRRWLRRDAISQGLGPVFETTFTRRTWRITPRPGTELLVMLDVGTIRAGERSAPISELELELASGEPADLLEFARQLAIQIPLHPNPLSKAERGYNLHLGREPAPQKAAPSPVSNTQSVPEALRAVVLSCMAQMQANEAGARGGSDPEFVHQMRVSLRRLRSALRVFGMAMSFGGAAQQLAEEVAQVARALGEARDWDVLAQEIVQPVRDAFAEDPRLEHLSAIIGERREEARAAAGRALAGPAYGILAIDLLRFTDSMGALGGAASPDLAVFAQACLKDAQRRAIKRARSAAGLEPAALHRLRIAVKRWRYALEFFAPMFPPRRIHRPLGRMQKLQEDLGILNDLANAGPRLEQCAAGDPLAREAAALIAGWHGPRHQAILKRLPRDIEALLRSAKR